MSTTTEPARESALQRALESVDKARRGERHHSRLPIVDLSLRDATETADGSYTITGHAATTNSEYVLYEDEEYGLRVSERIASNAFDQALAGNPDVHLNLNHDMSKVIARTGVQGVGGLELSMDPKGLKVWARVDRSDPDVIGLASKMRLGIVDQMSFAFTIADEKRTEVEQDGMTEVLYEILRVGQLYDVCVCAQGANPQTDSSIRSLRAAVGQPDASASWATQHQPSREALGAGSVSNASALGAPEINARARAIARMHARSRRFVKRDAFSVAPATPDPEEPNDNLGEDLAEAIEALSDLLGDGYDLSMPADLDASTTVHDEIVECIGYLASVLTSTQEDVQA